MIDLKGRTAIVFGVANKRSIAWGIAQKLNEAGARLLITYQNERLKLEAEDMIKELPGAEAYQCDVSNDTEIDALFASLKEKHGKLHILVHSVAFAPADAMHNDFLQTSRDAFRIAHDVSVYSLIAVSRAAAPLMTEGGSIITMTYYGSTKVIPRYNVMGVAKAALEASVRYLAYDLGPGKIRVNAISAGPIKTLAAAGVGGFRSMLEYCEKNAPLRRLVTTEDVGNAALSLCSDLGSAVTGETIYVDAGFSIMGMPSLDKPTA
jgi:enoyl-[acyl-carrier protein] reductase I